MIRVKRPSLGGVTAVAALVLAIGAGAVGGALAAGGQAPASAPVVLHQVADEAPPAPTASPEPEPTVTATPDPEPVAEPVVSDPAPIVEPVAPKTETPTQAADRAKAEADRAKTEADRAAEKAASTIPAAPAPSGPDINDIGPGSQGETTKPKNTGPILAGLRTQTSEPAPVGAAD